MKLYLVQHGDALSKELDPERPLSETGRRDIARIAASLQRCGVRVHRVLHSGKARAQQSAQALSNAVMPGGEIEVMAGMAPNDPVEKFSKKVARDDADIMLVGHLPFMARLAAYLLVGRADAELLAYRPGSVVCLERLDAGDWRLNWMLRPELLPE